MGDVLRIRRDLVEAMVAHARRDHPDEACGILAGPEGSDRPERFIEMTNAERSPTRYLFDGDEFLKVYRELDANDEEVVVIYHSHTATEAYPSPSDVLDAGRYAMYLPDPHYILISTRDPAREDVRSYRIKDGDIIDEPLEVVDASSAS
jgi:proteasome lid subunit RPN8/RPN11